jgi:hypothetical protein
MSVSVTRLNTEAARHRPNTGQVERFVALPFRLYQDCPQWVPPLVSDQKLQLDRRRYPFYEHSDADFFIAERAGRDVARIAVLENRHYNAHWGSRTAFFYLFESEDDPAAADAVFAAAEDWARRRGLDKMVGSKGFLQGDGIGILVEGFEHRPAVGIPYNHAYYARLIEARGYTRQRDFLSAHLPGDARLPEKVVQIAERMRERRGFSIKTFASKRELREWAPRIVRVYNDAFVENWEFNPITPNEGRIIGERMIQIADPKLIKLVIKGDTIAGFLLGFPDISEGIQKAKGRLWPLGWYWLWREFGRTRWINLNGAGILPAYRGLGVNAILYAEMEKTIREGAFLHADIVQMEESVLTVADAVNLGATVHKRHRIYEKTLA